MEQRKILEYTSHEAAQLQIGSGYIGEVVIFILTVFSARSLKNFLYRGCNYMLLASSGSARL